MTDDELDFITGKRIGPDPVPPRSSGMSDDARVQRIRSALGENALVPGTMSERAFEAFGDLDALAAEVEQLREVLRDAEKWLLLPSDTYEQHWEELGRVRESVRDALGAPE